MFDYIAIGNAVNVNCNKWRDTAILAVDHDNIAVAPIVYRPLPPGRIELSKLISGPFPLPTVGLCWM